MRVEIWDVWMERIPVSGSRAAEGSTPHAAEADRSTERRTEEEDLQEREYGAMWRRSER